MIRNSTRKFRQKYQNIDHHLIKSNKLISYSSQSTYQYDQSLKTTPCISRTNSMKKVENSSSRFKLNKNNDKSTSRTENSEAELKNKKYIEDDVLELLNKKQAGLQKTTKLSFLKKNSYPLIFKKTKNNKEFIQNLSKNSVFYCCSCFQYVFEIQKYRHYPTCKDLITQQSTNRQYGILFGMQRLKKIVLLSQYSKFQVQVLKRLYEQVETGQISSISQIRYNEKQIFFQISQILQAFAFTYDKLLKGKNHQRKEYFNCF